MTSRIVRRTRLPGGVWALGFVSLFMDASSEMIHALLPLFLTRVLGAGATTLGWIEGIGESTASLSRIFSGWLSDRLRRRKVLVLAGYGLAALSKPIFALAGSPAWVLAARFSDRLGKGIRGAPRDALVADLVPQRLRGAAYGLRQSLDTLGAILGPVAGIVLMGVLEGDFRRVFWAACVPAGVAVAILAFGVEEVPRRSQANPGEFPLAPLELRRVGRRFWGVVGVGILLTLARFSEAFLVLRAESVGFSPAHAPSVLVAMNVAYAMSAYPAGYLSDRIGRDRLLELGFGVLFAADLVLGFSSEAVSVLAGSALWGLHMGMTQGLLAALVADSAPEELRATGFGFFHLASGVALLLASAAAGFLWERGGARSLFLAGAIVTALGGLAWRALSRGGRRKDT
jgi:MFS family permease